MSSAISTRLYRKRRFVPSFDQRTRPLDACLEWVTGEGAIQVVRSNDLTASPVRHELEFVVLSHETDDTLREFEAYDAVELARWARTPAAERHAHEVVWTTTKAYVDIDMAWAPNVATIESGVISAFIDILREALEERFDVTTQLVVLDATRPNVKLSRHIIIDMHRRSDGKPVRFASSQHCGAFIFGVEASAGFAAINRKDDGTLVPLIDHGIYGNRRTLRTLGSTKPKETDRPLTLLVDTVAGSIAPPRARNVLDLQQFERSLVTWPRVTNDDQLLRVDYAVRAKRARTASSSPTSPPSNVMQRLVEQAIADVRGHVCSVRQDRALLMVNTTLHYCPVARRDHKSNTAYFLIDIPRGRYSRRCHDPECRRAGSLSWVTLDAANAAALRSSCSSDDADERRVMTSSAPPRLEGSNVNYASALAAIFPSTPPPL